MKFLRPSLITALTAVFLAAWSHPASSRPYPDRTGVCYFFRGATRALTQTCVISGGYGAGAHYAVLQWPDGVKTTILEINNCPQQHYDKNGFCKYTVDSREAKPYQRNVFFDITKMDDADNLDCYRVISTGNSVCYRYNQ